MGLSRPVKGFLYLYYQVKHVCICNSYNISHKINFSSVKLCLFQYLADTVRVFPTGVVRLGVKYIMTVISFVVMAMLYLPSTQSYNLHRPPYASEDLQIEPPLAPPYTERRIIVNNHKKDTSADCRRESDIPVVLLSSSWNADDLTDYTRDCDDLRQDISASREPYDDATLLTSADSKEPLVDLPTGILESVS
jgi:hypothetical protein